MVARPGYYTNRPNFGGCMGPNPKAPAWTPGPSSSGDRRGDSLGRIRRAVHGVGTHKSVDGAETPGVRGLNLPAKKDKHRVNIYSKRVQQAIEKKQIKRSRRKRKTRGRAGRRLARAAARLTRERQKAASVKAATYNVRSLSVEGATGYGRDEVVLSKKYIGAGDPRIEETRADSLYSSRIPCVLQRFYTRWATWRSVGG